MWRVDLDPPQAALARRRELLSPTEIARADRYVFDHLRRRAVAGQGALRIILGRYLGIDPREVPFSFGPKGKPYLTPDLSASPLQFNVSNTGDRALIAVTAGREVGVDIEGCREVVHGESVAQRHFAPAEVAQLPAGDPLAWREAFFNCWTRKEAFIKVTGEGLSRALDSFEVSLLPGDPPRLLRVDDDRDPGRRFTLIAFDPGAGFAAALVVAGPLSVARLWDLPSCVPLPE